MRFLPVNKYGSFQLSISYLFIILKDIYGVSVLSHTWYENIYIKKDAFCTNCGAKLAVVTKQAKLLTS